jgi:hypothetical protein
MDTKFVELTQEPVAIEPKQEEDVEEGPQSDDDLSYHVMQQTPLEISRGDMNTAFSNEIRHNMLQAILEVINKLLGGVLNVEGCLDKLETSPYMTMLFQYYVPKLVDYIPIPAQAIILGASTIAPDIALSQF